MPAFHVLNTGYGGDRVASTVSLIEAGPSLIVVDPGMVASTSLILEPLRELGWSAEEVTDVIFSHHHPDHTINAALFPAASIHDHWAIYKGDVWESRPAESFVVAEGVTLWHTPGHTAEDVTTMVAADGETVAFTHLWWYEEAPYHDPLCTDPDGLHAGRERVLEIATLIVPGHGPAFVPDESTAR
jgi:glyoxylase-like metal-dependent hydrolase (beta-lactamase superfamily II)